ncbi:MAG TPA: amino acid--[acyl-carrier-protein] ligase [Acidimicrobiales bacterium]|nr:amino acid--[acyl-carrier-protein] ligase [Acidimicrobiales bacterium]
MTDDTFGAFRDELIDSGLVIDAGVEGLYGRSLAYEEIVAGITGLTSRTGADDGALAVHFPPVIPRTLLERTDYLKSFPHLIGSVETFRGDDKLHARLLALVETGADWDEVLEPAEVVLRPAACHPVYPLCTDGALPSEGRRFEVHGWCFRHEPSADPARMLAFRMHEFVYVGDPEGAERHTETWVKRGTEMFESLGLEVEVVAANDPFFGRAGVFLAANQRQNALKLEFVSPVMSTEAPTAVGSVNRHQDHFGRTFGIRSADGAVAHSACFGVGVDRTALALLRRHGLEKRSWPAEVRALLWP